jgi:hypothetical protein
MEYIIIVGQFIKWALVMILLLTIINFIGGGTIEIGEVTGIYGTKTTQIRW